MKVAAWVSLWMVGMMIAAEVLALPAATPRTVDDLPPLAWAFLVGWAFAGWVIASLKPAVVAMNDTAQSRAVALAGIVQTLVASLAVGVGGGLYLLTVATIDGKPLPALYAYLGALGGGFWGMKGMEFATDMLKAIVERWAQRQQRGDST